MSKLDWGEMNYPQTVDDLLHWDTSTNRDSFGSFTVITGFEGTGRCFWCGEEIEGRRRYCRGRKGCWTKYQEHYSWGYAKYECLKRSGYKCANCGRKGINLQMGEAMTNLRAHHIIPLNGGERAVSVYNIFWNLICLCHDCHMELHAIMRPPKLDKELAFDSWEEAVKAGQLVFSWGQ